MEYLCRQLYAHRVTHHVKHMRTDYEETVRDVIKRMSEIQKLDLTRDKKLYESLLYHLPPMILRLQNNIQIVNPMLDNIKQEYPELFTTMWYALTQIELRYQVTLTEDEVSLILLHFQVALDQFEQVGNIVVVCTYGVSSSQLILSRVKQILPAKDNITVTNTKKLKEIDLSKVDLIISSVDIEDPEISYVKVNPLLTKDDYANILDAYTKQVLLIKNNVCDNQKNGIKAPTLKKYLEEAGIPAMIYYPLPLQQQEAFQAISCTKGSLKIAEDLADSVLSLPIHTEIESEQQDYIIETIHSFFNNY